MALEKRNLTKTPHDSSNGDRSPSSSARPDETPLPPPSLQTIASQFLGLFLGLILYGLRKSATPLPVLGWRIEMIEGVVPAECLIFSLLVLEMGWRDLRGL